MGRLVAIGALLLAACAAPKPPPPPPPTIVQVKLTAAPALNPDASGRPSPIVVKFFELKSLAVFDSADFFSLFDRDRETLGSELVAREEFQLAPGAARQLERTLPAETRYLAVVAAYRDLERSVWRATFPVTPNKTVPVAITLEANKVVMSGPR